MSTTVSTHPSTSPVVRMPGSTTAGDLGLAAQPLLSALYRLTVRQYDRLIHDGVIPEFDRVELVEGLLVTKTCRNRPHVQAGVKGFRLLSALVPPEWHVRKEDPVVASDWSKPEPDLAIVRGKDVNYDDRDVTASDVALVVEIFDSSLALDQQEMARVYASGSIAIYWVINIVAQQVEVYTNPESGTYRSTQIYMLGQDVPVVLADKLVGQIAVADLLPSTQRPTSGTETEA
jgi:Uma2 family endonuclease